ncbi:MAG: 4Fe-4S single cluster domain-containing protein [Candidatus Hodarchaeales archaeon]|jgi:anaerobic ribonucleoside-triphosphate reductase activating protein
MTRKKKIQKLKEIRISSIIPISEVNGPGPHYTIWVQGCSLNCKDCFNPLTHDRELGKEEKISDLIQDIKRLWLEDKIIGVTITGGEPFQQFDQIIILTKQIKAQTDLGIIILTGYGPRELEQFPNIQSITKNVDLIIAGRFRKEMKIQSGLKGSSNKRYIFTTDFYENFDLENIPQMEVIANELGEITVSGIEPGPVLDALAQKFHSEK